MKKESDQSSKDLCMLSEGVVKTKTEKETENAARALTKTSFAHRATS